MLLSYKCYSSTSYYLLLKADTARKDGVSFVMAEGPVFLLREAV